MVLVLDTEMRDYMENLPEKFKESMKELLGDEYEQYIESLTQSSYTAFRINTSKISIQEWKEINPFSTAEVAWTEKGFYYDGKKDMPSKHPYYYAGLYYIQEPSAMIPASLLPVMPEDRVLDLCAAPGGKATELGAKLGGTGLLVANDISVSRAMALAKNLQMAGVRNAVVTAESPERLGEVFIEYFDKILIDAPCSGEGMFRREPRMIKDWLEKGPEYYAEIQRQILSQAYKMLKPGGILAYSTCTFSVTEDEKVVQWLLEQYQDMEICPVERKKGFCEGRPDLVENGVPELRHCVRIFPHCAEGEGHFAVLLKKRKAGGRASLQEKMDMEMERKEMLPDAVLWEEKNIHEACQKIFSGKYSKEKVSGKQEKKKSGRCSGRNRRKESRTPVEFDEAAKKEIEEFLGKLPFSNGTIMIQGGIISLSAIPERDLQGIRTVYQGLPLIEWKHKLNISHQLALTLKESDFDQILHLTAADERVIRYLKGETISMDEDYQGNVLVCVDGFGLGWGQGNGHGTLKNKYYPGWRYQ